MKSDLRILLVDDEEIIHRTLDWYLTRLGHKVTHAYDGESGLTRIQDGEYDLALIDQRMPKMDGLTLLAKAQEVRPEMPSVIVTGHANLEMAIDALRKGAADFLVKPIDMLDLEATLERARILGQMRQDLRHLRETIGGIQMSEATRTQGTEFVGVSAATRQVRSQIVEAVDAGLQTVLVTGETGTGKEVVARGVHFLAGSQESPFIAVSCPALPDSLVESELFGHAAGSFTGATSRRAGCFELANGGTLFLDEVADLSPSAQAALLRVLDTRTFRPVGSADEIAVNVRVIAATNTDLLEAIDRGRFRADLFHRLHLYRIHLPPLRERPEDIVPLAEHFLSAYAELRGTQLPELSREAKDLLKWYDYPGNARELRNLIERAAVVCRSSAIQPEHFSLTPTSPAQSAGRTGSDQGDERSRILAALEQTKWNRREAAGRLGMSYSSLRRRIKKLGIG